MKPLLLQEIIDALHAERCAPRDGRLIQRVCTDSRHVRPGDLFVALRGPTFDGHQYVDTAARAGALAALVDRNIPLSPAVANTGFVLVKVADTLEALGRFARFYRRLLQHSVRVIAVTGSAGKTTTREMIYHVMSRYRRGHRSPKNFNNAVGLPLTLLGMETDHEFAVVELGTNHPGEIAQLSRIAEPDVAVITHVGPGHLEGLGDLDGVSREKLSIVTGLKPRGVLVLGLEHPPTLERARALGGQIITFGTSPDADVSAFDISRNASHLTFQTNDRCIVELPALGMHNVSNALAALAVCRRLGLTSRQFADAIRDFKPVPGRLTCRTVNNLTILDDSYNANPSSMSAALAELASRTSAGRRIFVCGDMCELGDAAEEYHRRLGREVAAANIDMLLTVGPQSAWVADAALEAGMGKASIQRCSHARRMARLIKAMLYDEDTILVKGSRSIGLDLVVAALERYRGGRPVVARHRPPRETARHNHPYRTPASAGS